MIVNMSTIDKLGRTLNALKLLHSKPSDFKASRNREKVSLCLTVADLISSSNVRNTENFLPVLSFTISSLLDALEDADSNTRLIIDESLNRIIRAVNDNHVQTMKVLNTLLNTMKKSSNGRSVKAALWRFAELSYCIRPQKAKLYIQYLIPVLIKVSEMKDEMVLETLGNSLSRMFLNIGLYSSENEVKILLRAFLRNLYSDSAYVRRSSVDSIIALCRYSRQPIVFFMYILRIILGALLRIRKDRIAEDGPVLGLFTCVRQILPYITSEMNKNIVDNKLAFTDNVLRLKYYWQIYKLCMHYCMSFDQNICATALETLHQLLLTAPPMLISCLTTEEGFSKILFEQSSLNTSTLSLVPFNESFSTPAISITDDCDSSKITCGRSVSSLTSTNSISDWNIDEQSDNSVSDVGLYYKNDPLISSSLINIYSAHFGNSDEEGEGNVDATESPMFSSNRAISVDNILSCNDRNDYNNYLLKRNYITQSEQIVLSYCSSATSDFIQIDLDIGDIQETNAIPLDYCARNLVYSFLSEYSPQNIRVSVTSLALQCLCQIFRVYPRAAFLTIEKNKIEYKEHDVILGSILSYSKHEDHQIRGMTCFAIGQFIKSALLRNNYIYDKCCTSELHYKFFSSLKTILIEGIQDESSICVRHSLASILLCVETLLRSNDIKFTSYLFRYLFKLRDNSYWLVKVKLLQLIGELPYELLHFVGNIDKSERDRIFNQIVIFFLGDKDGRIRRAAAECIVMYISKMKCMKQYDKESIISSYTISLIGSIDLELKSIDSSINFNFSNLDIKYSLIVEVALSKFLYRLNEVMTNTLSKYLIAGIAEVLCLLSEKFPPIIYPRGWHLILINSSEFDTNLFYGTLFESIVCLLTSNPVVLDIDVHLNLLNVGTRLFIAVSKLILKTVNPSASTTPWHYIPCKQTSRLFEILFQHIMRLATILSNIINNTPLISSSGILSSTLIKSPSVENPINWKRFESLQKSKLSDGKSAEEKTFPFGHYANVPLYVKLRESLQPVYNNYKVTLQLDSSDKFITFLRVLLQCIAQILDFTTFVESDRICEDLLRCLRTFIPFNPQESVQCLLQLLRSMYGTSTLEDYLKQNDIVLDDIANDDDTFEASFHTSHHKLTQFITKHSENSTPLKNRENYNRNRLRCKYTERNTQNILPSYIKLFEPMVISCLKQYTTTSNTVLQANILSVLTELVQLRVNFCLLDPDQTFITHILSQFQHIEETQLRNVDVLIPRLFNFLIKLADEKYSTPMIFVPRIIQLCDCLIASENTAFNCLAALSPVIDYIFTTKSTHNGNSNDIKELETQRDVLFAILLRLISNPKSLQMLRVIISGTELDEKRLVCSKKIAEIFFVTLVESDIDFASEDVFGSTLDLLLSLHPESYTSVQLFRQILNIYVAKKEEVFSKWLSNITACLTVLLCKVDESVLLLNVKEVFDHDFFIQEYGNKVNSDPLNVYKPVIENVIPEKAFVRFLFRLINVTADRVFENKYLETEVETDELFIRKLLSHLLILLDYIVSNDLFPNVKYEMVEEYSNNSSDDNDIIYRITDIFNNLVICNPILVLRWYLLLMKLKSSKVFSSDISKICQNQGDRLNVTIFERGLFLLACPFMKDNNEESSLKQFLYHNMYNITENMEEYPVHDFLQSIQNSSSSSELFIQVISNEFPNLLKKDTFILYRVLQCLEYIHPEKSGRVLLLCIQTPILNHPFLPISKFSLNLVTQNAEYLLTLKSRDEVEKCLSLDELHSVMRILKDFEGCPRNLITLLNKIDIQYFSQECPYDVMTNDTININQLCDVIIDKEWYLDQVKHRCCSFVCSEMVCAYLLSRLPVQDIDFILNDESFNIAVLKHCFQLGTELTKENMIANDGEVRFSDIYISARSRLRNLITEIKLNLPHNQQVYVPRERAANVEEETYSAVIDIIFSDNEYRAKILRLIPSVTKYVNSIEQLLDYIDQESILYQELRQELALFSVHCSEMIHWLLKNKLKFHCINSLTTILKCCLSISKVDCISNLYTISQIGSLIYMLYSVIEEVYNELLDYTPNKLLQNISGDEDILNLAHCSHLVSILIEAISKNKKVRSKYLPLYYLAKKLIVLAARFPQVYGYTRIPLEAWSHLSNKDIAIVNENYITANTLPEDIMQDYDFLKIFVKRMMFIGWKTRQQFEEWWVTLLTVLSSASGPNITFEESLALSQNTSVAVNAITSLLIQTIFEPMPGNSAQYSVLHISRNVYLDVNKNKWHIKLKNMNKKLNKTVIRFNLLKRSLYDNLNVNLERLHNHDRYDYNQISVEYLRKIDQWKLLSENNYSIDTMSNALESVYWRREQLMRDIGVASKSCIHFLLEYYSQCFSDLENLQLRNKLEIMKSLIIISDLFTERSQFSWLFSNCLSLNSKHPIEDDIMHQYITLAICKSAAVNIPNANETKQSTIEILISSLNSNYYPMQIASLHGLLYLLESIFKKKELSTLESNSEDFEEQILMIARNYAAGNLDEELLDRCSEHAVLCIISISFYLIENSACGESAEQIFDSLCALTKKTCKMNLYSLHATLAQGFYNIIVRGNISLMKRNLLPLITEVFSYPECTIQVALVNLQLLLALMYAAEFNEYPSIAENDTFFDADKLIMKMEKISIFFERIRKGFRIEAEIICTFLPTLLHDFFPPSEVLNKTINEFLSPQQPHLDLMSDVVFKVFQHAIQQSQLLLLQEWVLTLLNNFTQGYSPPIAAFCLTCFFISSSTNEWLIALFPKLKPRLGLLEQEDRVLLCISAKQFYSQLNDCQKATFQSTFKSANKVTATSPFSDIISILPS